MTSSNGAHGARQPHSLPVTLVGKTRMRGICHRTGEVRSGGPVSPAGHQHLIAFSSKFATSVLPLPGGESPPPRRRGNIHHEAACAGDGVGLGDFEYHEARQHDSQPRRPPTEVREKSFGVTRGRLFITERCSSPEGMITVPDVAEDDVVEHAGRGQTVACCRRSPLENENK